MGNSEEIKKRITKHYKRDSLVIYPPVMIDKFKFGVNTKKGNYYLIVSRLGGYKKIDIAVNAFNKLGKNLKVIGDGPQLANLKAMGAPNIEFLGRVSDQQMIDYLVSAKGLIFPTHEDFGIVPVEAMAAGVPVVAYKAGGALETVIDGKTGVFFDKQNPESIIEAVKRFEEINFVREDCLKQAEKFSEEVFIEKMKKAIEDAFQNKKRSKKQ